MRHYTHSILEMIRFYWRFVHFSFIDLIQRWRLSWRKVTKCCAGRDASLTPTLRTHPHSQSSSWDIEKNNNSNNNSKCSLQPFPAWISTFPSRTPLITSINLPLIFPIRPSNSQQMPPSARLKVGRKSKICMWMWEALSEPVFVRSENVRDRITDRPMGSYLH